MPVERFIPSAGLTPVWQPLSAQLPEKIGCIWLENETELLEPQVHLPLVHVCPAPHTTPQAPQLFASVLVSTQLLPHGVPPLEHAHLPAVHTRPLAQTFPQAPQLEGSE